MSSGVLAGLQVLGGYFAEMLSDHMSAAGCNDTPDELFAPLTQQQREELLADFNEYDQQANPDGWEPHSKLGDIPDFCWGGYFGYSELSVSDI